MRFILTVLCLVAATPVYANSINISAPEVSLTYSKGDLKTKNPTGFFGTRNNGGGNQQLGVLIPDTDGQYRKTEFSLSFPIQMPESKEAKWDIFFKGSFGTSDIHGTTQNFDAGAQAILIPGAAQAGFTILGPNGIANNLSYSHNYSWAQGEIGIARHYKINKAISLRPYGGVQYGHLNTNEAFGGNLPIVLRDFQYYTNINNDVISPFVGLEGRLHPSLFKEISPIPFEVFGDIGYALNFNDAKGTDSLAFTGFQTDIAAISENDKSHYFRTGLGLTLNPEGALSFSIGGNFERIGNIPQIQRSGTSNSNLSFGTANIWTGSVRATLTF